ncbi:retrotransposon protein, putative, ty1-copia subclass [Tanacetum coccineum]
MGYYFYYPPENKIFVARCTPSENTSEHHLKADHEDIEPQTALSDPEPDKWLEAMNAEMQSHKDNQVWNLVNLSNYNTCGDKWLFKKKTDIKVIRILMAILAFYDYEIWQMDVKTAFLNGHLYEDVYMVKPESSKQSTTAMSSTYAEYIAASEAAMEAIWIRNFIYGLDVIPSNDRPMDMYCDTTSAITIADEPEV